MTINLDEIEKALEELSIGGDHTYFRIHAPECLRLLVERVRKQDEAITSVSEYLTKLASLKQDYANNVQAVSEKIGRNMDESAGYWKGALNITEYYAKESLRLFEDKEST